MVHEGKITEHSYLKRYIEYLFANRFSVRVDDYHLLPSVTIPRSQHPVSLCNSAHPADLSAISIRDKGKLVSVGAEQLFTKSNTTAFLILKNGELVYERYWGSAQPNTVFRLFSITKSVLSALVAISMTKGKLSSLDAPVNSFLKDIRLPNAITLRHLMDMRSGIRYQEGNMPGKDKPKVYLGTDCNALLHQLKITDALGTFFHYNDYHPLLIIKVLEQIWGMPIHLLLEREIWEKIGAEQNALLTIDSTQHQFAKMESGLNCTARDLIKFGQLYLNQGRVGGEQLIAPEYLTALTFADASQPDNYFAYYDQHPWGKWFKSGKAAYQQFWWGYKRETGSNDYFAMGNLGQVLYISPSTNTIALRLGKTWGIHDWWPKVMHDIIHHLSR
jgi:CubicO group peptidase (beta-lactamase class C family)